MGTRTFANLSQPEDSCAAVDRCCHVRDVGNTVLQPENTSVLLRMQILLLAESDHCRPVQQSMERDCTRMPDALSVLCFAHDTHVSLDIPKGVRRIWLVSLLQRGCDSEGD